ncbi:hypothetical protein [Flyfo podovirus Tbat2_2]|nr:hypothetical protein [Flyfo podovirus Tbat2_2]
MSKFKVGQKVCYLRFDRFDLEYIGIIVKLNMPRNTILIDCNGERYLAPVHKLEVMK